MRVLIAGAASDLGSRVSAQLRRDGHEVWGITRAREDELRAAGVEPVCADVLDADATLAAVRRAQPDAIVQALNALPERGPTKYAHLEATNRLRRHATRNLVVAARDAGVAKYVCESLAFLYAPRNGEPADETRPLLHVPGTPMHDAIDAIVEMEREVRAIGGVIVRLGLFYGAGVGSTMFMAAMARRRMLPVFRGANGPVPWVHIDDAAAGVVAALGRGRPGEAYNVSGQPASIAAFVRELAASVGAKPPRTLPAWTARFAGEYFARTVTMSMPVSTRKAREELGWVPRYATVSEGVRTLSDGARPTR